MNTLPFLTREKKVPYKFYFWVVFFLSLSMALYVFPEALDIIRYYDSVESAVTGYSNVFSYAEFWIESHIDFIYTSSLFMALKIGMPMDIVTIFYMSLYYIATFEIIRKHFPYFKIPGYVLFYAAMFAPFIWVQSISRNLAAIAFFYVAISCMLEDKRVKAIFWFVVCMFTHISMLMYVPVILAALFLNKRNISNFWIYISILGALVLSCIAPSQLLNLIAIVIEGNDSRYALQYGSMDAEGALLNSYIGYGDKLPIVMCLVYSVLLLFLNKSKDFMYWTLYILTLMLSFFIFSSLMFTNRIIMLMMLFVAYNVYKVMSEGTRMGKIILKFTSLMGCFVVFLHFYSYRLNFSF